MKPLTAFLASLILEKKNLSQFFFCFFFSTRKDQNND
jgi:hypothetical protein